MNNMLTQLTPHELEVLKKITQNNQQFFGRLPPFQGYPELPPLSKYYPPPSNISAKKPVAKPKKPTLNINPIHYRSIAFFVVFLVCLYVYHVVGHDYHLGVKQLLFVKALGLSMLIAICARSLPFMFSCICILLIVIGGTA